MEFAIVDIETTGLDPQNERMTEIAVVRSDGRQILSRWSTLIQPGVSLPAFITRLTGISDEMLADAPRFEKVAARILEEIGEAVLVAHNVRFDYGFIRAEFARLGYDFRKPHLCTVALSRRYIKGLSSYKLSSLCEALHVTNERAHRALGDAEATAHVFSEILRFAAFATAEDFIAKNARSAMLPSRITEADFARLPNTTGVYYMYDEGGVPLYVGKSLYLRDRVMDHFRGDLTSVQERKIKEHTAKVDFTETGSELVALVLESEEIKRLKPMYNRQQRNSRALAGLFAYENAQGVVQLEAKALREDEMHLVRACGKLSQAKGLLERLMEEAQLCPRACGRENWGRNSKRPCFRFQIGQCKGVCCGEESVADYNTRVREALKGILPSTRSWLLIEAGRKLGEYAVVHVDQGRCAGWGFVEDALVDKLGDISRAQPEALTAEEVAILRPHLTPTNDTPDLRSILRLYISENQGQLRLRPLAEPALASDEPPLSQISG